MHLNCHTYYSLKYGMMSPEQLLEDAQIKGVSSLALTDINNTSGVLDFIRLSKQYGVKPVVGIDFRNGAQQQFIGIAKNNEGFRELNDLLSYHLHERLDLPETAPVLFNSYIIYPFTNSHRPLRSYEFIGVRPDDVNKIRFSTWKDQLKKLVILAPATFRTEKDFNGHRLLRAMSLNTILSKLPVSEQAAQNEIMLDKYELMKIYGDYRAIIENSERILEECQIGFVFGKNKNKKTFTGNQYQDAELLKKLCKENLKYRYPNPDSIIIDRYHKEINMITDYGFASYFLINWDIIQFATRNNYSYVGRGSGANSMVAYLLGITDVDPIELDLYFERFMNPSRKNPPDFDIDFSSDERDEVIKYIFKKHGMEHTAWLGAYSTLQENAIARELGKVFGLPKAEIDVLDNLELVAGNPDRIKRLIYTYGNIIKDFPSHVTLHACGILISELPIHYYSATQVPPKGLPQVQFSMLEAEDVGLYKFDILAQRGLGKIRDAVVIIKKNQDYVRDKEERVRSQEFVVRSNSRANEGSSTNYELRTTDYIDIHDVKRFKEDPHVRENLKTANLIGCFYVESPAMRMLLTKLKAQTYLDLVAASSIIRPGVAQSGMMREYILRFHDPKRAESSPKILLDIMKETFGVMVYQEDVIKVAHEFAGLSLDESDKLRRGMGGKYRGRAEFQQVKDQFFVNCREKKYPEDIIAEVWRQMESFGGYAFAKGHSASYAVESYQCMFLKTYYPLEYLVAVINNSGGFYGVEFYVNEASKCGGIIHAPDINKSEVETVIYDKDIYLGFQHMKELEKGISDTIVQEKIKNGEYQSFDDFLNRVSISLEQARILIRIGAFRFTGRTKQQLHWDIHMRLGSKKKTVVSHDLFPVPAKKFKLPELFYNKIDDAWDESEILDFFLCPPFDLLKTPVRQGNGINLEFAADLKKHKGKIVSIVGQLVTRKTAITKHKQAMSFGTFLDKNGDWIDTTHFPNEFSKYPFIGKGCYLITGKVVEEFDFYSIDVTEMQKLDYITREDLVTTG